MRSIIPPKGSLLVLLWRFAKIDFRRFEKIALFGYFFNCAMIIKTPVSSNQDLIPDIFLAGGATYSIVQTGRKKRSKSRNCKYVRSH